MVEPSAGVLVDRFAVRQGSGERLPRPRSVAALMSSTLVPL
ncbi:hypothetical protein [Streptomyces sp. ME18-1-4]|nr:hypothetical protein [Streptomyces sp. ME18-1-4]MDX3249370.1 hypothetical protein [Streptomyces sp. ME18-1-4]